MCIRSLICCLFQVEQYQFTGKTDPTIFAKDWKYIQYYAQKSLSQFYWMLNYVDEETACTPMTLCQSEWM